MERLVELGDLIHITGGNLGLYPLPYIRASWETFLATLFIAVIIGYGLCEVGSSDIGKVLKYIAEDELVVENAGLNTTKFKLFSFVLSAATAGIGGALWVHSMGVVSPKNTFDIYNLIVIIYAVMIGGKGSIIGPFLGSYICMFLLEFTRPFALGAWRFLILFAIGILIIKFIPNGLVSCLKALSDKISALKT
jgi:branched-chain amino acid transport system permease protein